MTINIDIKDCKICSFQQFQWASSKFLTETAYSCQCYWAWMMPCWNYFFGLFLPIADELFTALTIVWDEVLWLNRPLYHLSFFIFVHSNYYQPRHYSSLSSAVVFCSFFLCSAYLCSWYFLRFFYFQVPFCGYTLWFRPFSCVNVRSFLYTLGFVLCLFLLILMSCTLLDRQHHLK